MKTATVETGSEKRPSFGERKKRRIEAKSPAQSGHVDVVNCAICLMCVGAKIKNGQIVSIDNCTLSTNNVPGVINVLGECSNTGCDNHKS